MTFKMNLVTSDRIQDTLYAFMRSQILFTAIDLDIFSQVAAGHNTLTQLHEVNPQLSLRGLDILLNGLVGIDFLSKNSSGVFILPPDIANFLTRSSDAYMGGMVHHCKRLYENWSMLRDAVETGQPVGGAQSLDQMETYFAELVKGLYVSNSSCARTLADALDLGHGQAGLDILDVAGGSAVWSIAMLEKDPSSRATLLDFPSVIHVAETYVRQHQLEERFSYWAEDLESVEFPAARYDLAIMANICHALGPFSTQRALSRIQKTLKPGGHLVIVDFVPDDARSRSGWPLIFGVNMLVTTPEGDVFSHGEYEKWLHSAGFSSIRFQEIEQDVAAIIAGV